MGLLSFVILSSTIVTADWLLLVAVHNTAWVCKNDDYDLHHLQKSWEKKKNEIYL